MIDRLLVKYLRHRGWIVFWLDDNQRFCNSLCWLKEYLDLDKSSRT